MTEVQKKELKSALVKFCKGVLPYVATLCISVIGTLLGDPDKAVTISAVIGSALIGVSNA